jgi:hypothetical protein
LSSNKRLAFASASRIARLITSPSVPACFVMRNALRSTFGVSRRMRSTKRSLS